MTIPLVVDHADPDGANIAERLQSLLDAGVAVGLCIYISGLLATTQSSHRAEALVRRLLAVGYFGSGLVAVLGLAFPVERANDFLYGLGDPGTLSRPGFWMFACVFAAMMVTLGGVWAVLARQEVDDGEHARAVCNVLSSPFLVTSIVLPYNMAIISFTIAMLLVLAGLYRYAIAQAERGVFLSRFLSPQVSEMVRLQGLASVMQPREIDLTVVCCDLRGFTAYAEAVPSQAVIDLLGEYYDTVGEAVAEVDGTDQGLRRRRNPGAGRGAADPHRPRRCGVGAGLVDARGRPSGDPALGDRASILWVSAWAWPPGASRSAASGRPGEASTPPSARR